MRRSIILLALTALITSQAGCLHLFGRGRHGGHGHRHSSHSSTHSRSSHHHGPSVARSVLRAATTVAAAAVVAGAHAARHAQPRAELVRAPNPAPPTEVPRPSAAPRVSPAVGPREGPEEVAAEPEDLHEPTVAPASPEEQLGLPDPDQLERSINALSPALTRCAAGMGKVRVELVVQKSGSVTARVLSPLPAPRRSCLEASLARARVAAFANGPVTLLWTLQL